jgi:predicted acylesterase/phospholipase RssA
MSFNENKTSIPRKTEKQQSNYKQIASEGSLVILDARDLIEDIDAANSIKSCSWNQVGDIHLNTDDSNKDNKSILSFTAPYVEGNELTTSLGFELIITDKENNKSHPYNAIVIVKRVQRAIIFQGGAALGAYEAGVYQALVEKLTKYDEDRTKKDPNTVKRPLFDIVAGTSIGGMNAAIVVSSVTRKDGKKIEDPATWLESARTVIDFWKIQQQCPTYADFLDSVSFYRYWWDILHDASKEFKRSVIELIEYYSNTIVNSDLKKWYENTVSNWSIFDPSFLKDYFIDGWYIPATADAARRYYSAKNIKTFGALKVASGIPPWSIFGKFFDFSNQLNSMPRADNKHFALYSLKRTLEQFADFPIKTQEGEPRFLLVTVDVQTGDAVTFDSYTNQAKYHDDKNTIDNERGVEIEHALATGTFPGFFNYPKFDVNVTEIGTGNEEHIFWDGGFRSNTPLREVIQAHRDYWYKIKNHTEEEESDEDKRENDVPDLEVYIADLWPSELKEKPISFDHDFVENRKSSIIFGDRTDYDEQVANFVTDYIDLAKDLKNLAQRNGISQKRINHILNRYATSTNTIGETRQYRELLGGRFRLTKVVRIDHKDDSNDVADKIFDYSQKTIEKLIEVGNQNALTRMDLQALKDGVMNLIKINHHITSENGRKQEQDHHIEEVQQELDQIEETMKFGNGYDTVLNKINDFGIKVQAIKSNGNASALTNVKISLITASKQLQGTIIASQNNKS